MSEEASDFVEQKTPVAPTHQVILVKNEAAEPREWTAGGQLVRLEPGDVKRLPRWVYNLGLRYPNYAHVPPVPGVNEGNPGLRELNPNEGSKEWERAQLAAAKADLARRQAAVAAEQEAIKALEDSIKLKKADK